MDPHDDHCVYRNYGLHFLQLFVAALTHALTVKPAQLPQVIRYNSEQVMACPTGAKSHHFFLYFFVFVHIYPPFTRKRIVSVYFGR